MSLGVAARVVAPSETRQFTTASKASRPWQHKVESVAGVTDARCQSPSSRRAVMAASSTHPRSGEAAPPLLHETVAWPAPCCGQQPLRHGHRLEVESRSAEAAGRNARGLAGRIAPDRPGRGQRCGRPCLVSTSRRQPVVLCWRGTGTRTKASRQHPWTAALRNKNGWSQWTRQRRRAQAASAASLSKAVGSKSGRGCAASHSLGTRSSRRWGMEGQ